MEKEFEEDANFTKEFLMCGHFRMTKGKKGESSRIGLQVAQSRGNPCSMHPSTESPFSLGGRLACWKRELLPGDLPAALRSLSTHCKA